MSDKRHRACELVFLASKIFRAIDTVSIEVQNLGLWGCQTVGCLKNDVYFELLD